MKKVFFSIAILLGCCILLQGCIKNSPVSSNNPSMTASVGSYNFVASSVVSGTLNAQVNDTNTTLVITGYSSDPNLPSDKIVITVTSFKSLPGTWSIDQGQASGTYYHSGNVYPALGGVVSISSVTSTGIVGYFSFNASSLSVTNGLFNVGLP